MDFIQTSNKQLDKFGTGKHGFAAGNPGLGVLATYLSNVWCDAVQQELMNVIEAAGLTANPASMAQLLQAIKLNSAHVGTDTGVANAAVVTYVPAVPALADNMVLWFKAAAANTGATTLNVNGIGAKAVVGGAHAALQGGEIAANGKCMVVYSQTLDKFVLIECTGAALQVAPATQSGHALQQGQKVLVRSTTSGSTVIPAGVTQIYLSATAPGGGGGAGGGGGVSNFVGGGGGGGGAGQSVNRQAYAVTPLSTISWTIGSVGTGGTTTTGAGGNGGNAGNTVITGLTAGTVTLTGGVGGGGGANATSIGPGGSWGTGYPGGQYGGDSVNNAGGGLGGCGASSPFGGGGGGGRGGNIPLAPAPGQAAGGFGAGGGGGGGYYGGTAGSATGGAGAAGTGGMVLIET